MSIYNYRRRRSREVPVGNLAIGGDNPIRLQSMGTVKTTDIEGCAGQALAIADAGGEIVRFTTPGRAEARAMADIRDALRLKGCRVPLVADVHFTPEAALIAADGCEKVRINPGNFADPVRSWKQLEYTDEQYAAELGRIENALVPLLDKLKANGTALRLGVNHGSLSDRIMSRFGDTPRGMVESAMEYLRICHRHAFDSIVISIKSSETPVMVETVRLLVDAMDAEGMSYPLHLGVTEAGAGEDGRVKSCVGIGALLHLGLGDTVRVSLSEPPENEIPVARALVDHVSRLLGAPAVAEPFEAPVAPARDRADLSALPAGMRFPVIGADIPEIPADWHRANAHDVPFGYRDLKPVVLHSDHVNAPGEMASWIDRFVSAGGKNPVILHMRYDDSDPAGIIVKASADLGTLLLYGYGSGVMLEAPALPSERAASLGLDILQAAGLRRSKTDFVACPSCGRTLFDLPATLKRVSQATSHLKDLKIGVMGCIVNGPGEMNGVDYGYVGAAPGKVSLYRGRDLVERNIDTDVAVQRLIDLIKADGRWTDPPARQ